MLVFAIAPNGAKQKQQMPTQTSLPPHFMSREKKEMALEKAPSIRRLNFGIGAKHRSQNLTDASEARQIFELARKFER